MQQTIKCHPKPINSQKWSINASMLNKIKKISFLLVYLQIYSCSVLNFKRSADQPLQKRVSPSIFDKISLAFDNNDNNIMPKYFKQGSEDQHTSVNHDTSLYNYLNWGSNF